MTSYSTFFQSLADFPAHRWQLTLGESAACADRLLRIPTGFGKTAGVVLPWLYHRALRRDLGWPTRLAFTLPMRVLVEQTASQVRAWIEKAKLDVNVEVLMGGEEHGDWVGAPEQPTVLIGTQDMLLSRALNRGYAEGRARWPMDFGLLSQDALWIFDEVQLMDVGLMTGTQLAMFRRADAESKGSLRPSHTWWMSATLQSRWLNSVDSKAILPELKQTLLSIPASDRSGGLWDVRKDVDRRADVTTPEEIAATAMKTHAAGEVTLIIVNRVVTARAVFEALTASYSIKKGKTRERNANAPDLRLVHSRFRGAERQAWAQEFLNRGAPAGTTGRIIVATQVVEAGVDISAKSLVTELAPWTSLVQRFGRCARYAGENGSVTVVGPVPEDEKKAAPYSLGELIAADQGLDLIKRSEKDVSPAALERFEERLATSDVELLGKLYPYEPDVVLRRQVVEELFDTAPDLTGIDLDVGQYIRSGDERDVSLFWRAIEPYAQYKGEDKYPRELAARSVPRPERKELCNAPLVEVSNWITQGKPAWVLDYPSGTWQRRPGYRLVPGQQVMLPEHFGGYSTSTGFDTRVAGPVVPVPIEPEAERNEKWYQANVAEDDDSLSAARWKTVAFHGKEVAEEALKLSLALNLPDALGRILNLAGRWHDVGKIHEVFQMAIATEARSGAGRWGERLDLAKAPKEAWSRNGYRRKGFRHELASTLALFEVLRAHSPLHAALLGPHEEILAVLHDSNPNNEPVIHALPSPSPAEQALGAELAELTAEDFDLVAWLVCSHHGKVRCSWTSTPKDQEAELGSIHGVKDGDELQNVELMGPGTERFRLDRVSLNVDTLAAMGLSSTYGESWRERVERQLRLRGPFQLAYLEALFRAADWRASASLVVEELA